MRPLREVWRDLTSASHMRMFHIPTHWNVIPSSGRPTPQITSCLPAFYRAAAQITRCPPLKITSSPLLTDASHAYLSMYWRGALHRRYKKRCWERDRSAALGCSQSTKWDCDPSHDTTYQTKQETDCLLTFSRINRNPDSCHWTADVEKSRE